MRGVAGAKAHALAIGAFLAIVALFVAVEDLHRQNPALLLLLPILFITIREGRRAGLAYTAVGFAIAAYWLHVYGLTPGGWGEFDLYRLATFAVVTPVLVLLTSKVRQQASELETRRLAARQLELERDLDRARATLAEQEKLATIGVVVEGIAHELRTPLTAASNDLAIIERRLHELPPSPTLAAALDDARMNLERLERLAARLRPYVAAERTMRPVELHETAEESVRLLRVSLPGGHLVRTELAPAGVVLADPIGLQQVLHELLKNALEASPAESAVVVRTRRTGEGAELAVQDEGGGIPEPVRAHVFSEFFTTRPGARGLGLSIVRRHAEAHRARLDLQTTGRGTIVRLLFPLYVPVEPAPAHEERSASLAQ